VKAATGVNIDSSSDEKDGSDGGMFELDEVDEVVKTLRTRAVHNNAGGCLWASRAGRAGGNGAASSPGVSDSASFFLGEVP